MTNPLESIFDSTVRGLEKQLDLSWRRNQAITSNIANAETPGYRAVDLNFSTELDRAFGVGEEQLTPVAKTDGRHLDTISQSGAHLISDFSGATRSDGNNVDLDVQMGKLALNAGKYSMTTSLLYKKMSTLLNIIRQP
jgi:flagellar basal-body rod protein FlgB